MNKYFKYIIFSFLLAGFSICLQSCKEEEDEKEDFPEIDRGHTEVNRMKMIFTRVGDTIAADTAEIYDTDGEGGNSPIILDSLIINRFSSGFNPITYNATIQFYLGSSEVTGIINSNYDDYIVCYRDYQTQELELTFTDKDPDGIFFGLNTRWRTTDENTSGKGTIRVSLNYQPLRKIGTCDPGVRIFNYNLPYRLK